ncbi:MAG TPA: hypothetical protein VJR04_12990 [Terriglobales bacterium]|nr:hypothetical protein [Terriglobales bacterium]
MTTITFDQPITVGDIKNRITIAQLRLKSFSVNLAPPLGGTNVLVSLVLTDPVSGHDENYVYEDSAVTAEFVAELEQLKLSSGKYCMEALIERIQADGLLPSGTVTVETAL